MNTFAFCLFCQNVADEGQSIEAMRIPPVEGKLIAETNGLARYMQPYVCC